MPGKKTLWVLGDFYTEQISGEQTKGAYAALEIEVAPQNGPPLHRHSKEDEAFYVVEGDFAFPYGDKEVTASGGMSAYAPRGNFHTYRNTGKFTGKLLVIISPAGFEKFFEEIGVFVDDRASFEPPTSQPDIKKILQIAQHYGLEIKLD